MKWQPLILQWTIKSVHVQRGQWGVRGVQGSREGGRMERGEQENDTKAKHQENTVTLIPVWCQLGKKELWKKGPNKALPFWCRAAKPTLTQSSSLPIFACVGERDIPAEEIIPDLHTRALHADFYGVSAIAAYIIPTCWSHSFVRDYSPIHKSKFRLRGIKTKDLAPTVSNRFLEKWKKLQENESHLNFSTCNKKRLAFSHDCKPPSYIRQCTSYFRTWSR